MKMRKALIFYEEKWKMLSSRWGIRRLQEMMMYLRMY
jgi:hypothetical protein